MVLDTTLTSIELFTDDESVVTPVIIPLIEPANAVVVPAPASTPLIAAVTAEPTTTSRLEEVPKALVVIPIVWSAWLSITQTFSPLPHLPGFLAAQ